MDQEGKAGAEKGKKKKRQRRLFFSPFSGPSFSLSPSPRGEKKSRGRGGRRGEKSGPSPPPPVLFLGWPWLARDNTRETRMDCEKKGGEGEKEEEEKIILAPFFLFPFRFCLPSGQGSLSLSRDGGEKYEEDWR